MGIVFKGVSEISKVGLVRILEESQSIYVVSDLHILTWIIVQSFGRCRLE